MKWSNLLGVLTAMLFIHGNVLSQHHQRITLDSDFPGGNIIVDNCENKSTLYYQVTSDTINLRPDLRDTEGDWFYWYFRITGAAGQTLVFQFPGKHVGSFGPAFSNDLGNTWHWLYDDVQEVHNQFSYNFKSHEDTVLFCISMPYLQDDFDEFISSYTGNPYVSVESLTLSEKGRTVEKINLSPPNNAPKYKVLITARHHACEMMANYALEGFLNMVITSNDPNIKWLRDNIEFLIIPFVDKDGVEDGDQGKNRNPHDHNRDYLGASIYNSVTAIKKEVAEWSKGELKIALDMHCPGLSGKWHENIYFVGSKDKEIAHQQRIFIDMLMTHQEGDLKLLPENCYLEFGSAWNVSDNYSAGWTFSKWASTINNISLSIPLELPYSNNLGQKVTPKNASLFGEDLATATALYLRGL